MTPLALGFLVVSWSLVLGLTTWCFRRVLRSPRPGGRPEVVDANDRAEER